MARIHIPACFTTCTDIKNSQDARNVPKWINDGKQLLLSLESVKARLENLDLHQETRKSKARRCSLIREISRLYSCIRDCLELMERPRIMTGRLFVWNPERGTTRYFRLLRYDANRIIAKCESLIQNPSCQKINDGHLKPRTNLVAANPSTANDLWRSVERQIVVALSEEEDLGAVCIWGKTGTGKTTLAKKVFHNKYVRQHFKAFAWVSLKDFNYKYSRGEVHQEILMQLLPERKEDIRNEHGRSQLNQLMFVAQEERRCLVVLEDIRTEEDLREINIPCPRGAISKYLITTPLEDVAKADTFGRVFKMPPLGENECFNMLKERANLDDKELHSVGKAVFRVCGDHSTFLALVLGISLKKMDVPSRDQLLHQLDSLQIANQIGGGETEVLGLICDRLPHQLKSCLLYMGQFPQGQDIQIEKLYLLLAAEDLVVSPDNGTSGKRILDELTQRMLVEVTSIGKSCRLRDQIRNFGTSQGIHEKYFNIVDFKGGKYLKISASRLAINLSNYRDGRIGKINKRRICSLIIFDTNESGQTLWPPELIDLKDFIFLRVLDFDRVDFGERKLPTGIDKLLLLRYLSFQGCLLRTLPSFFCKLQCLETLDLRTICKMTIPNVINDMKKLRHLFFPMEYESADNSKLQLHGLQMLEILVNFDAGVCIVDDLCSLNHIRILTVISQGNINELDAVIQYSELRRESSIQYAAICQHHKLRMLLGRQGRQNEEIARVQMHSVSTHKGADWSITKGREDLSKYY